MLNIILFGPPGVGKGTQANYLAEEYKLIHISTGDLIRKEIKNQTTLGLKLKEDNEKGLYAPDEVVINLIDAEIAKTFETSKGYIFDGFPRTIEQAKVLDTILKKYGTEVTVVFDLYTNDDILIKRLLNRGLTSNRPEDNDIEIIKERINIYNELTKSFIYNYYGDGLVVDIDCDHSDKDVFKYIKKEIEYYKSYYDAKKEYYQELKLNKENIIKLLEAEYIDGSQGDPKEYVRGHNEAIDKMINIFNLEF